MTALPSSGMSPDEAALWRIYELTGADTSDGPFTGWVGEAVAEVALLRDERDRLADLLDETSALLDKHAHRIREAT